MGEVKVMYCYRDTVTGALHFSPEEKNVDYLEPFANFVHKEDYDALRAERDQLLKDIESGFMAGAYARLQSLQAKERQFNEVVAERDKLAERLKLKEVFLDPKKERVCYGFVLKTVTDRERIIYTEMPWTDYAMEVLGDRVLERITMVDKQRLDKAIEDLTRHKEMLEHMTLQRDTYAKCMAIALKEGFFPSKELVMTQIKNELKQIAVQSNDTEA